MLDALLSEDELAAYFTADSDEHRRFVLRPAVDRLRAVLATEVPSPRARAQEIEALRERAWETFKSSHDAASNQHEMSAAWVSYFRTLAALGPAMGHAKGPTLPPRVERALSEAYYRKLTEEVRRDRNEATE